MSPLNRACVSTCRWQSSLSRNSSILIGLRISHLLSGADPTDATQVRIENRVGQAARRPSPPTHNAPQKIGRGCEGPTSEARPSLRIDHPGRLSFGERLQNCACWFSCCAFHNFTSPSSRGISIFFGGPSRRNRQDAPGSTISPLALWLGPQGPFAQPRGRGATVMARGGPACRPRGPKPPSSMAYARFEESYAPF